MGLVYSEPACQSAYDGDVHLLYKLLHHDSSHLNVHDRHNGDTPLIAACRHGNLRAVRYLLDNGADVQLTNELQKQRQSASLMKAVLSSNVNVDAVDYKGNTALHYVCQMKSHRLVPLLLKRNADTNVQNNDGETPLDIATRLKFKKIVHMLKKTQ
ncbi:ankyrin repeat domain-containing protein 22 isoform X3 [Anarhichas minor]|uniref:ankyrin repeat domain-containing protein 22 isoform X3 n=1 Tax=Anarhichas minor TaxID=65739 RepID=UPI003F7384B8